MKKRERKFLCMLLTLTILFWYTGIPLAGSPLKTGLLESFLGTGEKNESSVVKMIPAVVDMKEADGPGSLYALSAVLMDGDSGRVLKKKVILTDRMQAPQRF